MQIIKITNINPAGNLTKTKPKNIQIQNQNIQPNEKRNQKNELLARTLALAVATGAVANPYSAKASDLNNEIIVAEDTLKQDSNNLELSNQKNIYDGFEYSNIETELTNENADLIDSIIVTDDDLQNNKNENSAEYPPIMPDPSHRFEDDEEYINEQAMQDLKFALERRGIELNEDGSIPQYVYISASYPQDSKKETIEKHSKKASTYLSDKIDETMDKISQKLEKSKNAENLLLEPDVYNSANKPVNQNTKELNRNIKTKNETVKEIKTEKENKKNINNRLENGNLNDEQKDDF